MIEAIKIDERVAKLVPIKNRGPGTTEEEVSGAFAELGVGDFLDGEAGWERHMKGDELVQVLSGKTQFDIIVGDDKQTLDLEPGMLVVVPRTCWHRFRAPEGVTLLTATPRNDEEHMHVEDPREIA
jgi:mannose-6-phosphate isomerase-like protein (cupin superfamily)